MFINLGSGALIIFGIIALFMPPNFEQWDDYKLYLLSNNPIKWAIGFIMCTLSAIEFIVWYLIFFQLLRLFLLVVPFFMVWFAWKALTLKPEDVSKVYQETKRQREFLMQTLSPSIEAQQEVINKQKQRQH